MRTCKYFTNSRFSVRFSGWHCVKYAINLLRTCIHCHTCNTSVELFCVAFINVGRCCHCWKCAIRWVNINFSELHRMLVFHLIFDVFFLEREVYSIILQYSWLMLILNDDVNSLLCFDRNGLSLLCLVAVTRW